MSPCTLHDAMNAMDEAIGTILKLAELGPLIDGNPDYFEHLIELLSLIAQQASHLEKLSTQLGQCVLPRPRVVEGTP
jgi:hypothetical protein